MDRGRRNYLTKNITKALVWLFLFIIAYLLYKRFVQVDYLYHLRALFENRLLMFVIFLLSEIIIGLIPPEVFMIWALQTGTISEYLEIITILSIMSYLSGIAAFMLGSYMNRSVYFRFIKRKFMRRIDAQFRVFGNYLILIAAMTPVPFAGVCMLVGATRYSFSKFLLFALARFVRFYGYAYIFWQISQAG